MAVVVVAAAGPHRAFCEGHLLRSFVLNHAKLEGQSRAESDSHACLCALTAHECCCDVVLVGH
jgi:hypothetical protein